MKTLLLLISLAFSTHLLGQDQLLKESLRPLSDLPPLAQQKLSRIQAKGMYTDYYLAEFGNLAEGQTEGKIKINLPDDDCDELTFRATAVRYQSEQDYSWYGLLASTANEEACYCRTGILTLVSSEYGKIGHIMVDDKTYELLSLGEDQYLLARLDDSQFTEKECGVNHQSWTPDLQESRPAQPRNNGNCNVRCLVLYTDNALAAEGSVAAINNRINMAITQTNQALDNSDIGACQLRVELAGVEAFDFDEGDDIDNDVNNLANNTDAQVLRNAIEADIVVLLTDGLYGGVFGIVRDIGPINDRAYAIVQTGAATTGRFTFAHEIAHLFGGGHDDDPRPGIPHGHSFKTGNFLPCIFGARQRTILHTAGGDDVRVPYYSNPEVELSGRKTGRKDKRDNARQLRNEACVVAQFRESVEPFSAIITGEHYTCPCGGTELGLLLYGGTAGDSYTYTWESSMDGINWSTFATSASAYLPPSAPPHHCPGEDVVFIRLSVQSSSGNLATAFADIKRVYEWPGQSMPCEGFLNGGSSTGQLAVFPNPSHGQAEITLQVPQSGRYSIYINNLQGQREHTLVEQQWLEGHTAYRYPITLAQKGLYLIQTMDEQGNQLIQKFLKL